MLWKEVEKLLSKGIIMFVEIFKNGMRDQSNEFSAVIFSILQSLCKIAFSKSWF